MSERPNVQPIDKCGLVLAQIFCASILFVYCTFKNLINDSHTPSNHTTNTTFNVSANATSESHNNIGADLATFFFGLLLFFASVGAMVLYRKHNFNDNHPDAAETVGLLSQHSIVNVGENRVEQSNLQSNINEAYDTFDPVI